MGLGEFFKKVFRRKEVEPPPFVAPPLIKAIPCPEDPTRIANLGDILTRTHGDRILLSISEFLGEWNLKNPDLGTLANPQVTFLVVDELEREVNSGGFHQYFLNSYAEHYDLCVGALNEIGQPSFAGMLQRAARLFTKKGVPKGQKERSEMLEAAEDRAQDDWWDRWDELDNQFLEEERGLIDSLVGYIRQHQADF